ncbi:hypothetical protein B0H13DRAFT_1904513 [Mycena leptocephala]|nr:hypothetical protein B0H13DRAFT_1904513 [Mycena leptocephala]
MGPGSLPEEEGHENGIRREREEEGYVDPGPGGGHIDGKEFCNGFDAPWPDYSRFNFFFVVVVSQRRSLDAADENREVMSRWIVAQSEGVLAESRKWKTTRTEVLYEENAWRKQNLLVLALALPHMQNKRKAEGNWETESCCLAVVEIFGLELQVGGWGKKKEIAHENSLGNPGCWLRTIALGVA